MVVPASPCAIPPVVWWVRRDMRLDDNPALQAALATGAPLIPVFVWSPEDDGQFQQGRYSRWWTKHTVAKFQHQLEQHGSRLIIRRASETTRGLLQVVTETGATAVFFNTLYDPISLVRDHEVKRALSKLNITCHNFNADVLYEPWEVLDSNKQPYTSFESFWKGVLTMPRPPPLPLPAPAHLPPVDPQLFSVDVKDLDWFMTPEQEASSDQLKFKWRPGLEGAVEKMESFLGGRLPGYHRDRAKVDRASTSMLSPWIHTGTLSVRYLFYRVCARQGELAHSGCEGASESTGGFLQQLGYREYSRYLTFHFPFIHERALLAHLRACPWRMDQQHFKAWRQGLTGYPLVDAAMRELWSTGWTHNRMRVVTASFMVKNLLLPWQWGLKHFWDAQMDADLECDALGWQYVSGGMADAKPFSYMMDLEKEAFRFDPDGEYVRRWLPVLSRLPTQYIHAPWTAPVQVLVAADVELGFSYPVRIITMEESRMNLARACQVLDSCAATSSGACTGGSGGHPYRAPTVPLGPSGKGGGSGSGQPGTGTGTVYQPHGGSSWPLEGQHGQGQGSNALQQQTARPVAGAAAAEAGGAGWQGGPRVQQWPRVQQLRGVEEAASHHKAPKLPKAERARLREEERLRCSRGGVAMGRANEWDLAAEEEEAEEGDEELGRVRMDAETAISSSGSDDMSDEEMESEEVVSNTVGLSAAQPSGYSALPPGALEEGEEISCRQQHPGGPNVPPQHHGLSRYAAAVGATTVPPSKGYQQQQQTVSEVQTVSCAGQQPPALQQQQPKQQQQLSCPQAESAVHQQPPAAPQQQHQQQQPEMAFADAATGSGMCVDRAPDLNPHRQPQYKYQQQLHQLEQEMEVRPPQYQYNHQQSMQQNQQQLYQQMQGQQSGQQSAVGKPQMPPLPPMHQQQLQQQHHQQQQQQWTRGAEASVGNKRQRSDVATEHGSGNCSEDVAYQQDS